MFVDASALTAILACEADADELAARLEQARQRRTSPMAVWETALAVARILGTLPPKACQEVLDYLRVADIEDYLRVADIELVAAPPETAIAATKAFGSYGKGRHKAGLNFGDCFSYACARHVGMPLLHKGGDFALTDIETA